jgi:hypothetical protein
MRGIQTAAAAFALSAKSSELIRHAELDDVDHPVGPCLILPARPVSYVAERAPRAR